MEHRLRRRFWFEIVLAIIMGILFVVVLINREYVGLIFLLINSDWVLEMDTISWVVASVLLVVTLGLFALAAYEWRRSRVVVAKTERETGT